MQFIPTTVQRDRNIPGPALYRLWLWGGFRSNHICSCYGPPISPRVQPYPSTLIESPSSSQQILLDDINRLMSSFALFKLPAMVQWR